MHTKTSTAILLAVVLGTLSASAAAQTARISEEIRVLDTYPFSEPNPIPILTRDSRLYPYHSFEGYAKDPVQREWKVVHLENDLIEVFVLPEVGGKVWGAIVKETGHEFIYRNEVMKFRNIALRGPWTSGGIELNFGVIGHTPATATPVDYALHENPDGSVSCFVGTMDLPSRTQWRVEIRLPADRAYFETNVLWYNPTPLEQPYYNWMTGAAFAQYDLEMSMPGNAYLTHPGDARAWPVDQQGRYLPEYANNTFAGHKSYHVVGELNDFFGGYYHEDDYGFGQWSRYEEMPGQKLWLWALSREGGVWEDLLTDTDGQYVEFQAGRLFVQYSPGSDVNPITQARFDPGAADRWYETWFPVEGIGGLTDASRDGAMYVGREEQEDDRVTVRINSFGHITDTLRVTVGGQESLAAPIAFDPLEPVEHVFDAPAGSEFRVVLPALGLDYSSDPANRRLARPFVLDPTARPQIPAVDMTVFEARELLKARYYAEARALFDSALAEEPWHRDALLGMADLEYRRGHYESGLRYANRAVQLDAYDADANFLAGNHYRAKGRTNDARDAFGWAVRSMEYRSVGHVQLAELAMMTGDVAEASRYARLALDYDRYSIPAHEVLAIVGRQTGDAELASSMLNEIADIDPLSRFPNAERFLSAAGSVFGDHFGDLHSEFPEQTMLELAVRYARRGATVDARRLLDATAAVYTNPLIKAWLAYLDEDPSALEGGADPTFVFPYRLETLPVLEWATEHNGHWSWSYLRALNLWALGREGEASALLEDLGDVPDFAPAYVARANLLARSRQRDEEHDLRRAVELDSSDRTIRIHLIRYLQGKGRWQDALTEIEEGSELFVGDFNLELLAVRSLNNLGRADEAIEILARTHVLPSENARESHRLYEQAHTIAALDAMDSGDNDAARRFLEAALDWPEHLGQGRPYDPEERLVTFLQGIVESRDGDRAGTRDAFESVAAATDRLEGRVGLLDLLAIPALAHMDQYGALSELGFDTTTDMGRFAGELVRVYQAGGDIGESFTRLAVEHSDLFRSLDGMLVLRALMEADPAGR